MLHFKKPFPDHPVTFSPLNASRNRVSSHETFTVPNGSKPEWKPLTKTPASVCARAYVCVFAVTNRDSESTCFVDS